MWAEISLEIRNHSRNLVHSLRSLIPIQNWNGEDMKWKYGIWSPRFTISTVHPALSILFITRGKLASGTCMFNKCIFEIVSA